MSAARIGALVLFFLHGVASGTWVARIPAVQESLELSVGELGLVLLGAGAGTLASMVPTGALIARWGSRRVVRWIAWPAALTLGLLGVAPSGPTLFVALVAWGASMSALDVALNAQGATIERLRGRPILSSLHAFWSLGNMSGAALGALVAAADIGIREHLLATAPVLLLGMLLAVRPLETGDEGGEGSSFAVPRGALLALAAVAFCAVTVEGAMFDWGGVYLRRVFAAPEATAASAASFFSAAMAGGRLVGDHLTARLRPGPLARGCALLAAAGVAALIVAPSAPVVLGGLVAVGFGLSILVPLAFSAAGRSTDMPSGAAIAAVATMSYFGFLVGPPTLGLVGEQVTLRGSFVLLLCLLGVVVLLAPAVGGEERKCPRRVC